jgi:hypothetical protein
MMIIMIRWEGVNWIDLTQDQDMWWALMNMVMIFWIPQYARHFSASWTTNFFSRRTLLPG